MVYMKCTKKVLEDFAMSYRTVLTQAEETLLIKKSRFIGYTFPIQSEEEANSFLESIRKKHWDATHNCFAYVLGEQDSIQKASDDGEPSGTAGKPILEVIKQEQIKDVLVVVTRYYGGILLGAGGLIRAYSQTASAALHASKIVRRVLHQNIQLGIDYSWHGKIEHIVAMHDSWQIADTQFTDRVVMQVNVPAEDIEICKAQMTDLTNGQAQIEVGELVYVSIPEADLES